MKILTDKGPTRTQTGKIDPGDLLPLIRGNGVPPHAKITIKVNGQPADFILYEVEWPAE